MHEYTTVHILNLGDEDFCICYNGLLTRYRGTGMIASGSTFCLYLGRVIRDLFRLLNAV